MFIKKVVGGILLIFLLSFGISCFSAVDDSTVWELRTTGNDTNGGAVSWIDLTDGVTYKWTAGGGGSNEYYCELFAGGDPSLTIPVCAGGSGGTCVSTGSNHIGDTEGTVDSLNAGEWDWADSDALGYSTIYVRMDNGLDPDTMGARQVLLVKGGGEDFTQQDAAEDSGTDLACADGDAAAPVVTSATHNFIANDVGNLIQIHEAGDGFTLGFYEIVSVAANAATLDRACGTDGAKTGGDWGLGGACINPATVQGTAGGQHVIYVKAGTYQEIDNNGYILTTKNSTTGEFGVRWEGYKTTRGDDPKLTDRPVWDCDAGGAAECASVVIINAKDGNQFRNFIWQKATGVIFVDDQERGAVINVRMTNSLRGMTSNYHYMINVEVDNMSDDGGYMPGTHFNSYTHDCADFGYYVDGGGNFYDSVIETTGDDALYLANTSVIIGTVTYNATGYGFGFVYDYIYCYFLGTYYNNIAHSNSLGGFYIVTNTKGSYYADYNAYYNNGGSPTGVQLSGSFMAGKHDVTHSSSDPIDFTNAAAGDFTLQSTSACIGAGLDIGDYTNITGNYKKNIGPDQDDNTAAGGGRRTGWSIQ